MKAIRHKVRLMDMGRATNDPTEYMEYYDASDYDAIRCECDALKMERDRLVLDLMEIRLCESCFDLIIDSYRRNRAELGGEG